jgi:hypothetical protein
VTETAVHVPGSFYVDDEGGELIRLLNEGDLEAYRAKLEAIRERIRDEAYLSLLRDDPSDNSSD